jgi:hypothetical protein
MKINALDLLNNAAIYRIDAKKHKIESSLYTRTGDTS